MDTIEKVARELFQAKSKICILCKQARFINEKSCPCPDVKLIEEALTAYESEKSLLEKTQDWHEHGTVAPSCVGCPTAKAMIEVDREKLKNLIVKWAECKSCPLNTFNENNKMVCTANVTTKRDCYLAVTNYLQKNDND